MPAELREKGSVLYASLTDGKVSKKKEFTFYPLIPHILIIVVTGSI